ncbi:MAG: hypothetical protein LC104_10460 [Bacteroidales bacterium]|nr:hypothetical protein [Bacteroidales bacterium]
MCVTGKVLLLAFLLMVPPESASLADIPVVDRQARDFYGAIATGRDNVTAEWSATPNPVPRDQDITLTLTIRSAANPRELTRPNLKQRSDFAQHFQIDDLPDRSPENGVAVFRYQLRPREAGSFLLPALAYRFYRPRYPEGRRFQTTYARLSEPIRVTEPIEKPASVAQPIAVPESFLVLVPPSASVSVPAWAWLVPPLLVPFGVRLGSRLLRWCFPNAAQLATARRNRAARVALRHLRQLGQLGQLGHWRPAPVLDAGTVAAILRTYLMSRHHLPSSAVTPGEITAALRSLGWPTASIAHVEQFFLRCDAIRFGPHRDNGVSLTEEAVSLVVFLEGESA